MDNIDQPVSPAERTRTLAAFEEVRESGLLDEPIAQLRAQFAWGRSDDFYDGYLRGVLLAAHLFQQNPHTERTLLGKFLLIQAGVVVEHQRNREKHG